MKKAIVFGGTGLVGEELIKHLINDEDFYEVETYSRRRLGIQNDKIVEKITPFDSVQEELSHIKADILYCCLGTTLKKAGSKEKQKRIDCDIPREIFTIAKKNDIETVVFISSIATKQGTSNFYLSLKAKVEKHLSELYQNQCVIVRPSLLLGDRKEFRFGEKLGTVLFKLFSVLMIGSWKKYKGIEAEDVAKAMIHLSISKQYGIFESDQLQELSKMY